MGKKGRKKGKGVVGKFSFRIVCQNYIPFFFGIEVPKVVKPTKKKTLLKTFGTSVINSLMSPSVLGNTNILYPRKAVYNTMREITINAQI